METWFIPFKLERPESPSQSLLGTDILKLKVRKQDPNIKAKGFAAHV